MITDVYMGLRGATALPSCLDAVANEICSVLLADEETVKCIEPECTPPLLLPTSRKRAALCSVLKIFERISLLFGHYLILFLFLKLDSLLSI
jgi:hypothetical protein